MPVKATKVGSTGGTITSNRARVLGLHWVPDNAGVGTLDVKTGSSTGPTLIPLATPADKVADSWAIPGGGIQFGAGVFVSLSNVTSVTVVYDEFST